MVFMPKIFGLLHRDNFSFILFYNSIILATDATYFDKYNEFAKNNSAYITIYHFIILWS